MITNAGAFDEPRRATIVGLLPDGVEITVFDRDVSSMVGDSRSTFRASYMPQTTGDVRWTATIFDDDPDLDEATSVTKVVP